MTISPADPRLTELWLRRELLASGLYNEKSLAAALRAGVLRRPRTGAYVAGSVWDGASAEERYAMRVRAAVRQARTEVVVSHASALPFLDAPTWGVGLTEVHLTRTDEKTGRREAGVRQHRGRLADGDAIEACGLVVSGPKRASLELSTVASVEAAVVVVDHFLHRGAFTIEELRARYEGSMERWPHSLKTDLVLRLADGRSESVAESRVRYHLWHQGLPVVIPQYEVWDRQGRFVARVDFALPEYHAWLEVDGVAKYVDFLRPGETVADAVLREKRREDLVREVTGWRCLRIVWEDLANPVALAARVRAFLGEPPHGSLR